MFRRLENAISEHKKFAEDVKLLAPEKLFSMHDAAARCVCDMLVHARFHGAVSLLAQYVVLDKEIQRRCEEV